MASSQTRAPASALADRLVGRLFRYLAVTSQSDAGATMVPSTSGQWDMARLLQRELEELGLSDIHLDDHAVLTARLPGTVEGAPRIGFCAHVDTVDVGLSPHIHPRLVAFDGTSVLGADDKAAVSVVMTLLETLVRERPAHGDVLVAFVPDEEIGLRGAKAMDLARFPAEFAYTIDCCALGEFVAETFNAAQATITITGVTAHPMSAKGVLVNPILVAADLIARFDPLDTPEHTDGRQGYCWCNGLTANALTATLSVSIRDFDPQGFADRKARLEAMVALTASAHPRAAISVRIDDVYANVANGLVHDQRSVALMRAAYEAEGIVPNVIAMRGGTDGSALSARGIPTPNLFTGALNFHSEFEFLPVPSFVRSYEVAARIVALGAGQGVRSTGD
jgi:tripeptide aminopeptidase